MDYDVTTILYHNIDESYSTIQLELCQKSLERQKTLFDKMLSYIKEIKQGEELYQILHNEIGMTDEEISVYMLNLFPECFHPEEDSGINLSG